MPRDGVVIVNPVAEDATERLAPAPRVPSLEGARVALIDNSKHNADRCRTLRSGCVAGQRFGSAGGEDETGAGTRSAASAHR